MISGGGLANTPSESKAANDVEDHMVVATVSIASKRLQKKKLNK